MTGLSVDLPSPREPAESDRRSWSQYNNYRSCPKAWQLSKLQRAPGRPGVWLPAGTAVHKVIEDYLRSKAQDESELDAEAQ